MCSNHAFHVRLRRPVARCPNRLFIVVAAPKLIGHKVPVQHSVAGRLRHQAESLEIPPHHLLDFPAAADVPRDEDTSLLPANLHPEGDQFDFDRRAVLFPVAPYAKIAATGAKIHQRGCQPVYFLRGAQVHESDLEKFLARITVTVYRGLVHCEATPPARLAHESRNRVVVEEEVILFAGQAAFAANRRSRGESVLRCETAAASEVEMPRGQPCDYRTGQAGDHQRRNAVCGRRQQPLREATQKFPDRLQERFDRLQRLHPTHPRIET